AVTVVPCHRAHGRVRKDKAHVGGQAKLGHDGSEVVAVGAKTVQPDYGMTGRGRAMFHRIGIHRGLLFNGPHSSSTGHVSFLLSSAPLDEELDMLESLTDPNVWAALVTLTLLEIVLGIDNIIFISILSSKLLHEQ